MDYRSVKTMDVVQKFADSALKRDYQTQLTDPLHLDEIDMIRNKPDHITFRMYDDLVEKYNDRFSSVIHLLLEIEDVKLEDGNYFDHNYAKEGGQTDPVIYENTFSFYVDDIPYHKDGSLLRRPLSPIFDTFEIPLGYLWMKRDVIVKRYVEHVIAYYTELFHKMAERKAKKEKRSDFELAMFDSIKKKLSDEEFKFLLKKIRLTKKLKNQLLNI